MTIIGKGLLRWSEIGNKKWWIRVFTTILGVFFVNAYLAYHLAYKQLNHNSTDGIESLDEFLGHLAYEIIFNQFLEEEVAATVTRKRSVETQYEVMELMIIYIM